MSASTDTQSEYPYRPRRNWVLKGGVVSFNADHSTFNCSISKISETGALLRFTDNTELPLNFMLNIEMDGVKVPCQWVRNVGNKIAVKFTGEFEQTEPVRSQGLQESFDGPSALESGRAGIDEIVQSMRERDFLRQAPAAPVPVKSARRPAKAFGKRKYEPKS